MPCVACFVSCPRFVLKFGFACRVVHVWVRIRLRQKCAMCVYKIFGALTRLLLYCRQSPRLFNMAAHCVEGMFFVCLVCSLSKHLGRSRVTVCFPVFNCRNSVRDRPLCRTLWGVESLIARELHSCLCVAVMFTGAYSVFRDFAFLLQVVVSVIFGRCSNSV